MCYIGYPYHPGGMCPTCHRCPTCGRGDYYVYPQTTYTFPTDWQAQVEILKNMVHTQAQTDPEKEPTK
jgi:hypothetical protein